MISFLAIATRIQSPAPHTQPPPKSVPRRHIFLETEHIPPFLMMNIFNFPMVWWSVTNLKFNIALKHYIPSQNKKVFQPCGLPNFGGCSSSRLNHSAEVEWSLGGTRPELTQRLEEKHQDSCAPGAPRASGGARNGQWWKGGTEHQRFLDFYVCKKWGVNPKLDGAASNDLELNSPTKNSDESLDNWEFIEWFLGVPGTTILDPVVTCCWLISLNILWLGWLLLVTVTPKIDGFGSTGPWFWKDWELMKRWWCILKLMVVVSNFENLTATWSLITPQKGCNLKTSSHLVNGY